MSRGLVTANADAADAAVVRPYLLVKLDYAAEAVRVSSLPFDTVYAGETYLGVGRLGSISEVNEGTEIKSYGCSLRMSGIPLDYVQDVVTADGQGRTAQIWLGFLDAGHVPVADPFKLFQGRIDVTDIDIGETIAVTVTLESRLVDWERARTRRFTDQDQKLSWPADRGLEYVQAVTDMELIWGRG